MGAHPAQLCLHHPVHQWDPGLLRLQGWDSISCQGDQKEQNEHAFFSFYFNLQFVLLVSGQPPDSIMTYTKSITLVLGIHLPQSLFQKAEESIVC